jgi:polysaccharide export outer membrane protein
MLKKLFYLLLLIGLSSCHVLRPSLMLKTPKNYKYDTLPKMPEVAYKISANDILEFKMYSNDGFKLIDMTTLEGSTVSNASIRRGFEYHVAYDGTVKLPVLGIVPVKGLTVREAESFLEEKYSVFYNKPFIVLKVTNKRVIVFPGADGNAHVIPLENDNTTLMEALALAGGIYPNGKAYNVKLIRGDPKNPKVYLLDLSTLQGFEKSDPVLQANDIIYVEARPEYAQRVFSTIAPYMSFITSMIIFYELLRRKL